MHARAFDRLTVVLSGLLVLGACDDGGSKASSAPSGGSNGGSNNTGSGNGGSSSGDGGLADASTEGEGGVEPAEVECSLVGGNALSFDSARASGRSFAAAMDGDTVHLVYQVAACSGTSDKNVNQGLSYVSFSTSGEPSAPADVANGSQCWVTRDPALASGANGKVDLFYTSNSTGSGFELFARELSGLTAVVAETTDLDNEFYAAASSFEANDRAMAVYINEPVSMMIGGPVVAAQIVTKQPGRIESEVVPVSEGYHAAQLAMGKVAREDDVVRGAVAWVSDLEAKPGIFLRSIDDTGAGIGEVSALSSGIGGSSNVDIATGALGAAVVYTMSGDGTTQEIRARILDAEGVPGKEIRLTRANQNVRDVAIAPYATGYVVAYRRLSGLDVVEPSIRLIFIDDAGNVGGARVIQNTTAMGVGLEVLVANDGRIVVVWSDAESVMDPQTMKTSQLYKLRAARLECL